ncbi:SPFH domain-containing protein [Streptosporangium sp. NPDC020072]|uniref:SPFH domain-containing protein n=1 Tax=Streptosporangium sp. NPDC020072 TaxID=3154788 RepID=UPI0034250737
MMSGLVVKLSKGEIGIVRRRVGRIHPEDEGREIRVQETSPGVQAAVLQSDRIHVLPGVLYEVTVVRRTEVPLGTIGVVVARDGAPPSPVRNLAPHVECRDFQDGVAFLRNGGTRGRQPGVLRGGASYAINTELFEVITVNTPVEGRHGLTDDDLREITIPEGTTGVVVVREGEPAGEEEGALGRRVPGHASFQLPTVFLDGGGQRGVQEETLGGGDYRINPWFARVVQIPTRVLVLDWKRPEQKRPTNLDSSLDQIRINVEGYWVRFDMSQTIQIPARAAPVLVSRVGEQKTAQDDPPVRRFIDKVLAQTVESYFQRAAAGRLTLDFLDSPEPIRLELAGQVREALGDWQVTAISTTIGEFEPEDTTIHELRKANVEARTRKQRLRHENENADIEEEIKRKRIRTERERRRLEAVILEEQVRLLGADHVAMERFMSHLKEIGVPTYVGGNAEGILQYMPLQVAQEVISTALNGPRRPEIARGPSGGRVEAELKRALTDQRSALLADMGGEPPLEQRVILCLGREDDHADVRDALDRFVRSCGWTVAGESEPVTDPWFQTVTIRAADAGRAATSEELEAELRRATDREAPGSDLAAELVEVLEGTTPAVLLVGPVLLAAAGGEHAVLRLGHRQLSHLIRRPGRLLTEPLAVVAELRASGGGAG